MFRIPAVAEKGSYAGAVPLDFWPLRRYTGHSQPIEALQGELDGILACPFPFSLMPVCLPEPVLQMGSCRKKGIPAAKNRNALVRKIWEVYLSAGVPKTFISAAEALLPSRELVPMKRK